MKEREETRPQRIKSHVDKIMRTTGKKTVHIFVHPTPTAKDIEWLQRHFTSVKLGYLGNMHFVK